MEQNEKIIQIIPKPQGVSNYVGSENVLGLSSTGALYLLVLQEGANQLCWIKLLDGVLAG